MFKKDIPIAIAIYLLLLFIMIRGFDYRPPAWASILFYLLIYIAVSTILKRLNPDSQDAKDAEPEEELPTSGPIGRFGQAGLIFTFMLTGLLSVLNPFQLVQIILQGVGNVWLQVKRIKQKENEKLPPNEAVYTLPFAGEWYIYNGGITQKTSHSWSALTQRYAYDFLQVNEQMERHIGKGTQLTDYYCFGQNILSAAEGTVVKVVNRVRSAPFVGYGLVDFLATNFIGNHIIIQHAENEYGLYAHLIKGTIPVKVGDSVGRGQLIGQCGHSGHSSEPHLHFHLQNKPNFYFAMGLPIQFSDVQVDGETAENVYIQAGDHISSIL